MITVESITVNELWHHDSQVFWFRILDTSIYNVGRALLHAQLVDFPKVMRNQILADLFIPMFEGLLDGIIPIRVLSQLNRVCD